MADRRALAVAGHIWLRPCFPRIGLGPKAAVPVSLAAISGTALSNLAFSATDRHPSRARPLIDYTTAVSMQVCWLREGLYT